MNIILTEIERHHDFHELFITDDSLLTNNQTCQLLPFLWVDMEDIYQEITNLLSSQTQRSSHIILHHIDF